MKKSISRGGTRNRDRCRTVSELDWMSSLTRLATRPGRMLLFKVSKHRWLTFRFRYSDNQYEYRHVQLPKAMLKAIPRDYFDPAKGTLKLLWEDEWRGLGITQVEDTAHF